MEELNFDKLYADKMRTAGAPDFSDEDWERLHPLLDARDRRRWRVIPFWWLGLLSGLLLCSNIGWWLLWRQSDNSAQKLQAEWQQVQLKTIAASDTSWKKVVVYQFDTVYRTVVFRQIQEIDIPETNLLPGEENHIGNLSIQTVAAKENTPLAPKATFENSPPNIDAESIDPTAKNQALQSIPTVLEPLPLKIVCLLLPEQKLEFLETTPPPPPQKRLPNVNVLIPQKFRLGGGAGFLSPQSNHLTKHSGYQTYLSAELAFSEQLALILEGAFIGVSFKGTQYDEKLGLPPLISPGTDYKLKYFETDEGYKNIIQVTLGMRYWLAATRKLSPYLGFGYAAQLHPSYELHIEFIDQVTNQEKERSAVVKFNALPVSLLDLNLGFRYRFSQRWRWQTGLSYQFKMNPAQEGIPRFWGLKSGVFYCF